MGVVIFCFVFLGYACDKKKEKSYNQENLREIASKSLLLLSKPDQEIVALLAVKYDEDADLIEKIVDQYLTDTDYFYRNSKQAIEIQRRKLAGIKTEEGGGRQKEQEFELLLRTLDKSSYTDMVAKVSHQFSLKPSIVASILIDYKTWKAAEKAAQSQANSE